MSMRSLDMVAPSGVMSPDAFIGVMEALLLDLAAHTDKSIPAESPSLLQTFKTACEIAHIYQQNCTLAFKRTASTSIEAAATLASNCAALFVDAYCEVCHGRHPYEPIQRLELLAADLNAG